MNGQLTLGLVRDTDPATSHAAARSVDLKGGQARVLDAFNRIGFGTDRQIAQAAGPFSNSTKEGVSEWSRADVCPWDRDALTARYWRRLLILEGVHA